MTSKTTKVRFVYCPQCQTLLIELSNIPVYKCGGCGTILKGIIPWISHILRSISTNDCWFKRHRWTGRYEAHLWDNSCRREGQTHKVYLGGYNKEEKAARAYDLAALKYWGSTTTNFPITNYEKELRGDETHDREGIHCISKKKEQWLFSRCFYI